jgi:hypothetical protein
LLLALFNAGRSIDARIAMIAITIKSSIRVKTFFIAIVPFYNYDIPIFCSKILLLVYNAKQKQAMAWINKSLTGITI